MKKLVLALFLLLLPTTALATDWAYPFVVYEDMIYEVVGEPVEEVGDQIGEVTFYSDMYTASGNFSNHYPKGTPYYEIVGTDAAEAIAVEDGIGYLLAENRGEFEHKNSAGSVIEKMTSLADPSENSSKLFDGNKFIFIVIGTVIIVLILILTANRAEKTKK